MYLHINISPNDLLAKESDYSMRGLHKSNSYSLSFGCSQIKKNIIEQLC